MPIALAGRSQGRSKEFAVFEEDKAAMAVAAGDFGRRTGKTAGRR